MRGIILAGGSGSRLHPITRGISKQLLPVYDKPMVYYPLSVLMLAGIQDVLIISAPRDLPLFQRLLGDGSALGLDLRYAEQPEPGGIAEAFLIGTDFINGEPCALVLGDNIFHGNRFSELLHAHTTLTDGCVLFGHPVADPERYGIGELDADGRLVSIEEKPSCPRSNLAITGLYFYDGRVSELARELRPSPRGELEITDLNLRYLAEGKAKLVELGRGFAWLDTGTHDSLMDAGQYIQTLERRQGIRIACLEEVALRMGFIDVDSCYRLGKELANSGYGQYVMDTAVATGTRLVGSGL
ncbi:glucose-1-phosphate thymidylyltransferase RfbA [Streptomyces sp. NPDC013178]|uniref:glucose-1-phosphate thymidylyltransferase RfbA n=1 Tax=Streptomyces sp. NPDC013178 TaxID=3155118 RepID=UPI0033E42E0A